MHEILTSADDRLDMDARGISRDIQEVDRVIMVPLPHITDGTVKNSRDDNHRFRIFLTFSSRAKTAQASFLDHDGFRSLNGSLNVTTLLKQWINVSYKHDVRS